MPMMPQFLCRKCHDWEKCSHSQFRRTQCSLCWKENVTCAVCYVPPPIAVRTSDIVRASESRGLENKVQPPL
jgi:hypothetical protein